MHSDRRNKQCCTEIQLIHASPQVEPGLPVASSPRPSLDGQLTMPDSVQVVFPLCFSTTIVKDPQCTDKLGIGVDGRSIDSATWPLSTTWIGECPTGKNSSKLFYSPIKLRVHTRAHPLQQMMHNVGLRCPRLRCPWTHYYSAYKRGVALIARLLASYSIPNPSPIALYTFISAISWEMRTKTDCPILSCK